MYYHTPYFSLVTRWWQVVAGLAGFGTKVLWRTCHFNFCSRNFSKDPPNLPHLPQPDTGVRPASSRRSGDDNMNELEFTCPSAIRINTPNADREAVQSYGYYFGHKLVCYRVCRYVLNLT